MSDRSPADTRDQIPEERRETNKQSDNDHEAHERNADEQQNQNKGHGPLKGTDTPATTNAEDLDKAKRTTL